MIILLDDKDKALEKAMWIFGKKVLDEALASYTKEIKSAYIGFDDFTRATCLVINGGGFDGLDLCTDSTDKLPYLEKAGFKREYLDSVLWHDGCWEKLKNLR